MNLKIFIKKDINHFSIQILIFLTTIVFCYSCGGNKNSESYESDKVAISGKITYDRVPNTISGRLDYSTINELPARRITVEIIRLRDSAVLASTQTDESGNYSAKIAVNDENNSIFVRAKPVLKPTETTMCDVSVVDNTQAGALYVMDCTPFFITYNSITKNLHAGSGWNGTDYSSTRTAAPFAIIDTIYSIIKKINDNVSGVSYPKLVINWSINNIASEGNKELGQITTSHYNINSIYLLGKVNSDTDEYDQHVIIHEWGHYFENEFSRFDSIGGNHSAQSFLDIRVAFSEGWANALSAMITDNPVYSDSYGSGQAKGFTFDLESNDPKVKGWYSEGSVQSILYDLYDTHDDGFDSVSLGIQPFYEIFTKDLKNSVARTSLFAFISALKNIYSEHSLGIDQILEQQNINGNGIDPFGSSETNDAGAGTDVLPVYTPIVVGDLPKTVCVINKFALKDEINRLSQARFAYFEAQTTAEYQIQAVGSPGSNPDFKLYNNKDQCMLFDQETSNQELSRVYLSAGTYVLEIYDWKLLDPDTAFDSNHRTCIDVSVF